MKTSNLLLLLLLSVASTSSIAQGNDVFTEEQKSKLIEFVETLLQCRGIAGLTLAVVQGNDTWTRGFGLADRETGRNVTSSTLFPIGSVTKAFTSAVISLFINETGRYSWETPLVDILGEGFEFVNKELTSKVTLKDILSHRTGLEITNLPFFAGVHMTRAELGRRIRYLPVKGEFRDVFDYNNWMYGLAGYVVEKMGGAPWEELLQTRFFNPLGMNVTTVLSKKVTVKSDSFAKPYVLLDGELVPSDPSIYDISPLEAAGAIASSADDMTKWMLLHINKGKSQSGENVLNSTRMREMHTPYVSLPASFRSSNLWKPEFPITVASDSYGYGWFTGSYRGYPMVWHSGNIFAYSTFLAFIPAINLGVFVSTNGPGDRNASHIMRQVFYYVADLGLGEGDPWLNLTTACQYPAPWRKTTAKEKNPNDTTIYDDPDFDNVGDFVGKYQHRLYGDVDVLQNGSNNLAVKYGRLEGKLYKTDAGNLTMWEIYGSMTFMFRAGNETTYMALNFSRPSDNGVLQEVAMSMGASSKEVLVFTRDGYNSGGTGGGRRHGVNFYVFCLPAWLYLFMFYAKCL